MRGIVWTLAVFAFVALPPAGAAKPPSANPVLWEPPGAKAGDPIDVVLTLSGVGSGMRDDVAIVIHGRAGEVWFPAVPLGSGRYRSVVSFPFGGGWEVRVGYGRGESVPLGKGAILMRGPPPTTSLRAAASPRPARVAGALALLLCLSGLAVAAFRSASRGSPALPG